ncbi:MAG: penicillin-insensitive murein endopeptidase [Deltaproteobacteria bacterium]
MRLLILSIILLVVWNFPGDASAMDSESIGYYTAGCVRNSSALSADGLGFHVIRPKRERFYGHPSLIEYVSRLGERVLVELKRDILIGDLSQKRGGPLPDDHSSHQTGLDADILFHTLVGGAAPSAPEREAMKPRSLLSANRGELVGWQAAHGEILRLAAAGGQVDRIFVNPLIKKRLCGDYAGEAWLGKIRPWWGHDGHFHVRLRCPEGSPQCESQDGVEAGDGCGADLSSWFTADGRVKPRKSDASGKPKRQMPRECLPPPSGAPS